MSAALRPPVQTWLIVMALAAIALLALLISRQNSESPLVLLFLVGSLLGIALYHSLFGFTGAFRMLLAEQRSAGFRAQMVMLGGACLLFFPALASGNLFGQPVEGFVSPLSISVVIGSFLFGIGMQLGGGCASGTLFTVGGGSTRMLVTLLFFILGAMLGLTHLAWWKTLPAMAPASMIDLLGWPAALLVNISVFALAYTAAARSERLRYGSVESIADKGKSSWLRGPWPLLAGALALALLNFTTLYLAGRPWGITSAFALWGGSVLQSVGVPVGSWSGFDTPAMQNALAAGPLGDITSVMDFGIVLGALLASGLAGKFLPVWRIPLLHLLASIIGGLLLGYGSRIAYGCNIGAFFSGIASGSLHGWVWIVFALIGNRAGIALRPLFKL
ncbi:MAG: YeeE/YedE family protein [Arenimonas sp.]|uniref:YeeE/YedE family protein n=1 Tax=Arenimonas sp. TaxID=1872635 RepID=UPI003C0B289C